MERIKLNKLVSNEISYHFWHARCLVRRCWIGCQMSNERLLLFKILEMSCLELTKLLSDTDILVGDYFHPKEWQGTLPFHNCAILHRDAPLNSTSPWGFIDLFDFSKGGRKFTHYNAQSHIIRFNPMKYPLPNNGTAHFATGSSGFQLITNLLDACHREGRHRYMKRERFRV